MLWKGAKKLTLAASYSVPQALNVLLAVNELASPRIEYSLEVTLVMTG